MEACGFRDAIADIRSLGAEVLGASADDVRSQRAFAERYAIPFPLLCDTQRTLAKAYGVLKEGGGIARSTYLIDSSGTVVGIWPKVSPAAHAAEVIKALRAL